MKDAIKGGVKSLERTNVSRNMIATTMNQPIFELYSLSATFRKRNNQAGKNQLIIMKSKLLNVFIVYSDNDRDHLSTRLKKRQKTREILIEGIQHHKNPLKIGMVFLLWLDVMLSFFHAPPGDDVLLLFP